MKEYVINNKVLNFKPHEFEGKKSIEYYENQIISSLSKIGVFDEYIEIVYNESDEEPFAQALWQINEKEFVFRCSSQKTTVQNIGAISQAIQEDIRQITRGIKDLFAIMNQYESTKKVMKKKNLFDYGEKKDASKLFCVESMRSDCEVDESLDSKYEYLRSFNTDKLDLYYLRFKEECIKSNTPNHPMLKALKIIRQQRGLKL